jgi:hypothetical protein
MRLAMKLLPILFVLAAAACGKEIGDECVISSDCSPNGDRQCDTSSKEGYCTIQGCDYNTCPEEAACIRFFTGDFTNRPCNFETEDASTSVCSFDEICGLSWHCVPRSSEVRYCMRRCESQDDCRDGYECRDIELMKVHGGEPVLAPDESIDGASGFCAAKPAS